MHDTHPLITVKAAPKSKAQNDPEKLSHHIHRIGYHFPSAVVDQACDWLGYNSRNGRLYRQLPKDLEDTRLARRLAVHSRHETNDQIKAAVRDLFPQIPDADLEAIVKHAFRQVSKQQIVLWMEPTLRRAPAG